MKNTTVIRKEKSFLFTGKTYVKNVILAACVFKTVIGKSVSKHTTSSPREI
jgi:hypothetical protein